jgi:hypothetical protein
MIELIWSPDPTWAGAQHAIIGEYELIAYAIPRDRVGPPLIGWEIFAGYRSLNLVAKGSTDNLDAAKAAAEQAWRELQRAR